MTSLDRSYQTSVEPNGRSAGYLAPWAPVPKQGFRPALRTGDPLASHPEPAMLARATAEVRIALEQAASAAEEAAAYARAVANVLASLSDRAVPAPAPRAPCADSPLSPREREVLSLVAEGRSNKEVATLLDLGLSTVETHRSNLMQKLNLHNTAEIVLYAVRKGLIV